ncbi:hypothetical protein AB1A81_07205 [Bdellovibrio bacteriovorus]|uniref:Lipoprotein n=1 Tax=Bdellovibrio bacteriovorus (strain ATCC 15356 / DSM 50701 / NCIMB 9529 / HD100) TaxID=264462 RepID=Q6MMP5_BDEBA|nr:hypothetical protein [Bdellovibrio bacteriovorus]AHZ84130.1 hypothetical protein EP01_04125 [Bdellovibrio bacteriovorus]BEV68013.1 hypothetical protein Bb109J_c1433 [Bdellovibrio bacteriovorus]CAE79459.1 hypothetical protein predicted by Glimmer/Critica [Bdellovibrio bacteriovorus HD100]
MKSFILSSLFVVLLSGCTIYRSEGRKQFESEAPDKVAAASFQLISCKKEGKLETWFNEEFPSHTYELVISETDLEIWRTLRGEVVEVKALQKSEKATQSCIYQFANETIWTLYKDQFIRELENNLMTLE